MKILKFYTDTCMPCKVLGKTLDRIKEAEVTPVNATEALDMVDKYNVCSTPTLIFLNNEGEEVERTVGLTTEAKIKEIIKKFL